jgi:hypothetical protein
MSNFRTKIRTTQNLRTKILAIGVALCATPVLASQPVWQPAIYCAALDFTRAELLSDMRGRRAGLGRHTRKRRASGRAYLRIAAEALDCPSEDVWRAISRNATQPAAPHGGRHRSYGVDRRSWPAHRVGGRAGLRPQLRRPSFWPPRAPPRPPIRPRRCARTPNDAPDGARHQGPDAGRQGDNTMLDESPDATQAKHDATTARSSRSRTCPSPSSRACARSRR